MMVAKVALVFFVEARLISLLPSLPMTLAVFTEAQALAALTAHAANASKSKVERNHPPKAKSGE